MSDHTTGSVNADGSEFHGPVVGVNLGTIIYGRQPEELERQRLVRYLEQLANSHRKMRVVGLSASRLESGIELASVYVMLAMQGHYRVVRELTIDELARQQQGTFKIPEELGADRCLPDQAIVTVNNNRSGEVALFRAELATETVAQHQHLVLCGVPGSGKSTFAKHLVWALAQRGLDQINQQTSLLGWADNLCLLPIFIPLRRLTGALAGKDLGLNAEPKIGLLLDAIEHYLHNQYGLDEPRQLLAAGLAQSAKVLFLFDGLDEVPLEANERSLDRASLLTLLRIFADWKPNARMLITCRSRAWTQEFSNITQWPMVDLAPFTGGQITHFINYWFPQLVANGVIGSDDAQRYSKELLQALHDPKRQKLRQMAENPLLLSMMIFVLAENGVLPRDRHSLYEQMLGQLLGQWDAKREGQNLGQAIGDERITSQELRNRVLDHICYQAHLQATSEDGRGRIPSRELKLELMEYFDLVKVADPYRAAERCIAYIDQRSGLLQPEDTGNVYAFAHLTLQEHSAGRHLLFHESIRQILALRRDDRWREPIFLGVGCLTSESLGASKISELLTALIDQYEYHSDHRKHLYAWYRDLVLAAELGADRDWGLLSGAGIDVRRIKRILREGLAQLLNDREHGQAALDYYQGTPIEPSPLLVRERQNAAELLAGLGDPRYPVSLEQWQQETHQLSQQFGREGNHYWRYVPAGSYKVGGWDEQETYTTVGLEPYWVGRFMVTVEQYQAFIQAGGYQNDDWWSKHGCEWNHRNQQIKPWAWDRQIQNKYLNQPVYGVSWYESVAYCSWLNQQLKPCLPQFYQVCLASEAEWDVAVFYNDQANRQTYPWGNQSATPEYAVNNQSDTNRPLSVDLGLIGQSACGVADSTSDLWEWLTTPYSKNFECIQQILNDSLREMVLRGISYNDNSRTALGLNRVRSHPFGDIYHVRGFRCVIARR
ncbi:MAG: SUMF1/EgtB/PvdO family nonheme iron enzyme [Chloroflexi bacterium]|nr:SUMF1/EgtB/PvdO family nonheme iron enzyme [Chloroflexota bacterium]